MREEATGLLAWLRAQSRARRARMRAARSGESEVSIGYAEWVARYDTITPAIEAAMRSRMADMPRRPLISVLMPVYNPNPEWLGDAIASVQQQLYTEWELCIADDCSPDPRVRQVLERASADDRRIRVVFRDTNGHISAASNSALSVARGEYIALLDHDDLLPRHALLCMAETALHFPQAGIIYSDEDKLDARGERTDPAFKCDWNPELVLRYNLVSHFGMYRTALLREIGGFRAGFEGSQDYDLALRCIDAMDGAQHRVVHVPHVLYHWRVHADSTAAGNAVKPYALEAGRKAIAEHLSRRRLAGEVHANPEGWYRVAFPETGALARSRACVIDAGGEAGLRESVLGLLGAGIRSVVIHTAHARTGLRREFAREPRVSWQARRGGAVPALGSFVAGDPDEILAFVMSTCDALQSHTLSRLAERAALPGTGLVSPKLVDRDGRICGGGILLGVAGACSVLYRGLVANEDGYFARASACQNLSAVDAGCVFVRREVLEACGGLAHDYRTMRGAIVDLGLRIDAQGIRNVWMADACVTMQLPTGWRKWRERRALHDDHRLLQVRWPDRIGNDPAYSPNLTRARETFALANPPRVNLMRPWFEDTASGTE